MSLDDAEFSKRTTVDRILFFNKDKVTTAIDVDCDDFEIFKSDLCQSIKKMNSIEVINQIKESGCIELLLNKNEDVKLFILLQ